MTQLEQQIEKEEAFALPSPVAVFLTQSITISRLAHLLNLRVLLGLLPADQLRILEFLKSLVL